MIGTSPEFQQAVSIPHQAAALVEVEREGVVVRTLAVHAGSVDADRSGRILRRFACSVSDPTGELTPAGLRDDLAPFGTILRLYRGVRIPIVTQFVDIDDSTAEWDEGDRSDTVADNGDLILGLT